MAGDRDSHPVGTPPGGQAGGAILDVCDRVLQEVGRRRHLFSWLRAPGSGSGSWLPVAAYYPSHRLVVVWQDGAGEDQAVYREMIPAHGLRLLELDPDELETDPEWALRRHIEALGVPPRLVAGSGLPGAATDGARFSASLMRAIAPPQDARHPPGRHPPSGGRHPASASGLTGPVQPPASLALGLAVGLSLAVAIAIELFVGVGNLALAGGHWVLAFGLALDAVSRALGTVAVERAGETEWTWWCVIGGSPVVASFTLLRSDGRVDVEPGPIAGLVSVLAMGLIALAVVGMLVGI